MPSSIPAQSPNLSNDKDINPHPTSSTTRSPRTHTLGKQTMNTQSEPKVDVPLQPKLAKSVQKEIPNKVKPQPETPSTSKSKIQDQPNFKPEISAKMQPPPNPIKKPNVHSKEVKTNTQSVSPIRRNSEIIEPKYDKYKEPSRRNSISSSWDPS